MVGKLNPQIKTVEVGVRSLKEVTLYPLSLADQFKASDLVVQIAKQFMGIESLSQRTEGDVEFIEHILDLIKNNAENIFALIADEGALVMDDLTNDQLVEIATIVYEVNYKSASKKLKGLFKNLKTPVKRLEERNSVRSQTSEQSSEQLPTSSETQEEPTD